MNNRLAKIPMLVLCATVVLPTAAAADSLACANESISDRPYVSTSPCTPPRSAISVESEYFQNASSEGGTQQAAYPLGKIRYGLSDRFEVFVDPSSAFAKNGLNGKGVYGWAETGFGTKWSFVRTPYSAFALTLDQAPQLDETSAISVKPAFATTLASRFVTGPRSHIAFSIAHLAYYPHDLEQDRTQAYIETLAYSRALFRATRGVVHVSTISHVQPSSTAQSRVGVAAQHDINGHLSIDAGLGTAINATGNTKAHYLEAGMQYKNF